MIRKAIVVCILIFLFLFCQNLTPSSGPDKPIEESAGHALLDSLVVAFKELAEMREAVIERTGKALVSMMKGARTANAQEQIDTVFFKRFHRILMVIKIVITPVIDDGAGIMKPLYFGAINQFITDIEGEPFDLEKVEDYEAINKITEAISHEIINLRLYLDNKEKREKLLEEYQELLAISPKSPELAEKDRQLMSMKDMDNIHHAVANYKTDYGILPKQAGPYDSEGEFSKSLSPSYIKILPVKDSWGNNFHVYTGKACNGIYDGIKGCTDKDIIVISFGRDGKKENWKYNPKRPEAGLYELKSDTDYDKDLVMWNDYWIRAPRVKKK